MLNKKALAGTPSTPPAFVEDVFSTYLYTGNSSTQTITNGIDLAGKGGLVWIKSRNNADGDHALTDTTRGRLSILRSNLTNAVSTASSGFNINSFNADGFTLGDSWVGYTNSSGSNLCSWTFREQPKFFDVVTYTGNGATSQTINHNLGSVPGMMIAKRVDGGGGAWNVYHRSLGATKYLIMDSTSGELTSTGRWNDTAPTSTQFTVGTAANTSGGTYIAYLFAHDAGGFGTAGTDNVISCGSFTCPSSGGVDVNLGYEPQYILIKKYNSTENWAVYDVMRGWANLQQEQLYPNLSAVADAYSGTDYFFPTATGFRLNSSFGLIGDYIYMAIRRPMKVPTTGTSVFSPNVSSASVGTKITTGFPVDLQILGKRAGDSDNMTVIDRLRKFSSSTTESNGNFLETTNAGAENTAASASRSRYWDNTGFQMPSAYEGEAFIFWNFRRASGFFDEVCYTGTGSVATQTHNLGVAPEFMIIKSRNTGSTSWVCYHKGVNGGVNPQNYYMLLQSDQAQVALSAMFDDTAPTSSVFTVGAQGSVGAATRTYVAYLFATCAGVSKVGSYTGNGGTQAIACGFTGGARFVLIKRTDDAGDWYVYDTARGMTLLTDPYLRLNSTAAESATLGSVTTTTGGFTVNAAILADINTNAASYIFLAIA
jgi:hypothetical protein